MVSIQSAKLVIVLEVAAADVEGFRQDMERRAKAHEVMINVFNQKDPAEQLDPVPLWIEATGATAEAVAAFAQEMADLKRWVDLDRRRTGCWSIELTSYRKIVQTHGDDRSLLSRISEAYSHLTTGQATNDGLRRRVQILVYDEEKQYVCFTIRSSREQRDKQ
jgi:hypothetical protein